MLGDGTRGQYLGHHRILYPATKKYNIIYYHNSDEVLKDMAIYGLTFQCTCHHF